MAGLIVTERLGSTVLIDDYTMQAAGHWIIDRTKDQVRRELMAFAAARAIDVDPRAIRIRLEFDYLRNATRFEAVWSPSTEDGVELLGGPADGTVYVMRDEGKPRSSILYAQPETPMALTATGDEMHAESVALRHIRYDLHGINDRTNRWVYRVGR